MLLKGDAISLRALEPADLDLIYTWENDPKVWEVSHTLAPFSKYVLRQYLDAQHLDVFTSKQLRLVVVNYLKVPVGLIDLFDFDPKHKRAGIGILIDPKSRGKGYAGEAIELLEDYCFNHLDLHQLYANIGEDNLPSLRLFERLNYQKIGTKKDWIKTKKGFIDEVQYQKING
ncbi:MAG: GNAT family N-acetyltransferase [Flavobacteriales bacterium]|nr:GNAT family N-acetyltransferase [Flavobacteriales bacterium]|tara:strand:- start:5272 stop:5790 length:519 start_codon:yes stop_codon:yes gene_type:complete